MASSSLVRPLPADSLHSGSSNASRSATLSTSVSGLTTSFSKAMAPSAAQPSPNTSSSAPNGLPVAFGRIVLDITNSVVPLEKLSPTPSSKDGLTEEVEGQLRSLACDLIQVSGRLLRLPATAMATGCVLLQRFYYAKSFVRLPFDVSAMACLGLACKIEECPRRTRDIINVFRHIKQVRAGKPITSMLLDQNYVSLKNQVIKAERRVLKELGFCVHVKHPHKIIVMYLRWLQLNENRELVQMSWVKTDLPFRMNAFGALMFRDVTEEGIGFPLFRNFMNDCLRTDVFVRYPPETIAVACIYLSSRKLAIPLPKSPAWFDVLGVEEDDVKDCCYRMISLYSNKKPNQDELEAVVDNLRKKLDESRKSFLRSADVTPSHATSTPPFSRNVSPTRGSNNGALSSAAAGATAAEAMDASAANGRKHSENDDHSHKSKHKKSRHNRRSRSRSRSHSRSSYDRNDRKRYSPSRGRAADPVSNGRKHQDSEDYHDGDYQDNYKDKNRHYRRRQRSRSYDRNDRKKHKKSRS